MRLRGFLTPIPAFLVVLSLVAPARVANAQAGTADCPTDSVEFREVNVGGVALNVGCLGKSVGGKPTVIFLHGFPEYWASWQEVALILAKKFRVVMPDQRGYNLSDKPLDPSSYQLQDLVGDVAGLIQAVSPDRPVILVGHDLGGIVAYVAASQLPPGTIAGLIVANAPHPNVFQQLFLFDLDRFPPPVGQLLRSAYIPTFFPAAACPLPGFCPFPDPEIAYSNPNNNGDQDDADAVDYALLIQLLQSWGGASLVDQALLDAWNRTLGPSANTHLTTMLNWYRGLVPLLFSALPSFNITVPTLLLWGTQDPLLVRDNIDLGTHPDYPGVQTIDQFIANLSVKEFPDASHFIQHEQPIEVAAEMKKFIDSIFASSRVTP